MVNENDPALNLYVLIESVNKISRITDIDELKIQLKIFSQTIEDVKNYSKNSDKYPIMCQVAEDSYSTAYKFYVMAIMEDCLNKRIINQEGSYVYMMFSEHGVKIGKSIHPKTRTKNISTQMPFKIISVESFIVNHMTKCETYLHKKYKDKRLNGEWFDLSDSEIKECRKYLNDNYYECKDSIHETAKQLPINTVKEIG